MTRRERVQAALRGEPVDRAPISLWHHFPGQDDTADALAASTVAFQARYDCDLVKLMPTGMYPVMDYGVAVRPSADAIGTTRFVRGPIREPADWSRLPEVAPDRGVLGAQVEAVRLVRAHLGPGSPVIQTIFSPLTVAAKLAGDHAPVLALAASDPDALNVVLARLAGDVVRFGRACLEAGADGFFFATQLGGRAFEPAYRRFGVPYDLRVLERLRGDSWCTILHLHGTDPLFELADEYPVDAVNWHDRDTRPTLSEGLARTRRALVAGIARGGAIAQGRPEEAAAEVRDAVRQTAGRRLIVAPGCVIPYRAPESNLSAARRAVGDGTGFAQG
jgi:uroporphyrinogen decarboxylase